MCPQPASGDNPQVAVYRPHSPQRGTCSEQQKDFEQPAQLRYQVTLAGNSFFHITEIATGRVRGFRANHNEACALARKLDVNH